MPDPTSYESPPTMAIQTMQKDIDLLRAKGDRGILRTGTRYKIEFGLRNRETPGEINGEQAEEQFDMTKIVANSAVPTFVLIIDSNAMIHLYKMNFQRDG